MAITGTLFGMTKTKSEIDSVEIFKSMMLEVNASGAVVMDGRNIAAGSIYANQLHADSITASKIKAGEITTDHITTSGISADKIKTGTLTATNSASWINMNNGQFSFGNGKIVYNGSTLAINVESLSITNNPVATKNDVDSKIGKGKWIGKKYNWTNTSRIFPSLSHFAGLSPVETKEIEDTTRFSFDSEYYLAHFYTNVYSDNSKTFSLTIGHDDDCSIIVNNSTIYEKNTTGNGQIVSFTLSKGWNKIDLLLHEITGGDQLTFNKKIGSEVEDMSCYIGGTSSSAEIVNIGTLAENAKEKTDNWTMSGKTTINGGKIEADSITATQIAANTITANLISAGTITADRIKVGTITADRIQANTITADRLLANTITAREIGVGVITAQEIKAGAITVDKLSVGDFTNYGAWNKTAASYPLVSGTLDTAVFRSSKGSIRLAPGQSNILFKSNIDVVTDESIYFEFWIKTDSNWNGTAGMSKFRIGDENGTHLYSKEYPGVKTSWTKYSGSYTVPVAPSSLSIGLGNDGTVGNVWIDDIIIKKKSNGSLLVDGTITADHITSTGITADKIKTGRLNATNGVSWIDLDNGQFSYGNGKITYNGSTLAVNVDSLQIRSQGVPTQIEAQGYADTAVSNLEIGGRNLWVDSNAIAGHNTSGAGTITGATATHQVMQQPISVTPNGNITYQVWNPGKIANGSNTNRISFFDANMVYLSQVQLLVLSGATYQTSLIKVPSTAYNARLGVIHGLSNGAKDSTIKIKFEKGDKATDWTPAPEDVDAIIAQAQTDATNAKNSAGTANQLLADLSNDNILTPVEKKSVKKEWDIIVSEKSKIDVEATEFGVVTEKATYNTHYSSLNTYITPLLANLNANSAIVAGTFRAYFKNYYDARQDVLNAITSKTKTLADKAQSDIDNLEIGGRNYFTKTHVFSQLTANSVFLPRDAGTPNGFRVTGNSSSNGGVRLHNVITENGWWTVSFDIKGSQSVAVGMTVEICDLGGTRVLTNNTNTYSRVSVSVKVTNYSSTVYHFVDFEKIGWNYFWVDNIKVEKGNKATEWTPSIEDIDKSISDAQSAADNAKASIADMSSDSKITPVEKVQLKKEWATIASERASLDAMAATYVIGAERTNMTNAYNTLNTVLNGTGGILLSMTTTSTVVGATFRGQFDDYYEKKSILQRKATEMARALANSAQTSANTANTAVGTINGKISNAVTTIDATGITVKDGSFYLEDKTTDTKYSIVAKENLIKDHSFEEITNFNDNGYDVNLLSYAVNNDNLIAQNSVWRAIGNPYIHNGFGRQYVLNNKEIILSQFGSQSATVNNGNYLIQSGILIRRGMVYTLSAFFKNHMDLSIGGIPQFVVSMKTAKGETINVGNKSFPAVSYSETGAFDRRSYTFTVPGTAYDTSVFLEISIKSADGNWVNVDGIQLVENNVSVLYSPEPTQYLTTKMPSVNPKRLLPYEDLNDITQVGFYFTQRSADAATIKNSPTGDAFSLLVERHAGTTQTLTTYRSNTQTIFIRNYYYSDGWGTWKYLYYDTGWVGLSFLNGYARSASEAGNLRARRINNTVYLAGGFKGPAARSDIQISSLPANLNPGYQVRFDAGGMHGTAYPEQHAAMVIITSDGRILLGASTANSINYLMDGYSFAVK